MGPWSNWSACSAHCDTGTQVRTREVIVDNQYGGLPCPATLEQQACQIRPCPTTCQVYFILSAFNMMQQQALFKNNNNNNN